MNFWRAGKKVLEVIESSRRFSKARKVLEITESSRGQGKFWRAGKVLQARKVLRGKGGSGGARTLTCLHVQCWYRAWH